MDERLWDGVVRSIMSGHAELMEQCGMVLRPQLFAFADGRLRGFVQLRPVYRGQDAAQGIAEMSGFAAAAGADEVIAAWETQDLAVACDLPPIRPDPSISIVWAVPERHVLYRFPYLEEQLPGRTEDGLLPAAARWLEPEPAAPDAELEPAIEALLDFSFEPFDTDDPDVLANFATYLESQGYTVSLTI